MLNRRYYFEACKKATMLEQYLKMQEEMKEVQQEIIKGDNTNLTMEILDLIQASHNLLNKLEDSGVDVEGITRSWKGKMEHYRTVKYADN